MKGFFSSYTRACREADDLLFSVGKQEIVDKACASSPIGKLTPEALYVHESVLGELSPLLRIFEGCARGYVGRVEGANIIKLLRHEPRISYLCYPEFDTDPHPALVSSVSVHLRTFRIKSRNFTEHQNLPILHRKETFVSSSHPLHSKFANLDPARSSGATTYRLIAAMPYPLTSARTTAS
jgi:DNA phosphorothioation-associated putative methyltransferase